jgi:hypothetical protein
LDSLHYCALPKTSIDEKYEFFFEKLSFIWMKILNAIACNLNSIQLEKNRMQISEEGIENLL